ncbi:radical SAM family heme chaperone HemW [Amycolatopsis sp., V23-08]|uniref:Heme chaperone HemW n=1 Tax=Amycolatopsis heterodermiae TaxID=3110235 RepID=A0ABU5R8Q4_9PSEU|nr:radical SAM family heme chaperone HemW [Amycolatopsis sp., V23-08]MEA5362606.1 radical SAM family heme chaperone HemW [Amycolatopsis sp., V23-08]
MASLEVLASDAATPPRNDAAYVFHHPPKFLWHRDEEVPAQRWERYSIYLHVPFCKKICTFCTFERKRLRRGSLANFADHLWRELDLVRARDDFSAAAVHSVYIGGGTGSLLPNADIVRFLRDLRDRFGLSGGAEVTLECEPGTKSAGDYEVLLEAGVNRVSIGIQAFQDDVLRRLNRSHDVAMAVSQVRAAKEAGFENLHIDLMYGLPGQSTRDWEESLDRAIALEVPHISVYPLIVFPDELLDRQLRQGDAPERPSEDAIEEMRETTLRRLEDAGLSRYSLTEYSRPGHACDYVITTWDGSDYLGLGPGAYSRAGGQLWENDVIHAAYERRIAEGLAPVGKSIRMSGEDQLRRDLAMSLCMIDIDTAPLERRAGVSVDTALSAERERLVAAGYLTTRGSRWTLTEAGIRYATEVMKTFAV